MGLFSENPGIYIVTSRASYYSNEYRIGFLDVNLYTRTQIYLMTINITRCWQRGCFWVDVDLHGMFVLSLRMSVKLKSAFCAGCTVFTLPSCVHHDLVERLQQYIQGQVQRWCKMYAYTCIIVCGHLPPTCIEC